MYIICDWIWETLYVWFIEFDVAIFDKLYHRINIWDRFHALLCQGNFGPEKLGPVDQLSMKNNGSNRPNFLWHFSPVVEFGSAM